MTRATPHTFSSNRDRWRQLRRETSIFAVLEAAGALARFRRSGNRLVGPCPIHRGENPNAFSANLAENLWFCFTRCQRGGNALELAWELQGRSWPRTARWLEALAAPRSLPLSPSSLPTAPPLPAAGPSRMFRPFRRRLPLEGDHAFLRERGITPATARCFETGAYLGGGFLRASIAVRLHDADGLPLGYAARRLGADDIRWRGKWAWPPAFPKVQLLYNWHRAAPHIDCGLIVVEGLWSVMKLAQAGFANAVALGGTTISSEQARLLSRAPRILLLLDGDDAGHTAAAFHQRQAVHRALFVRHPPERRDPADLTESDLRRLVISADIRFQPPESP